MIFLMYINTRKKKIIIFFGDLTQNRRRKFCLSYDTELLNYIFDYCADIDYVIYYNENWNYVEALKVANIPLIKEYLPECKYKVRPLMAREKVSTYAYTFNLNKEDVLL